MLFTHTHTHSKHTHKTETSVTKQQFLSRALSTGISVLLAAAPHTLYNTLT